MPTRPPKSHIANLRRDPVVWRTIARPWVRAWTVCGLCVEIDNIVNVAREATCETCARFLERVRERERAEVGAALDALDQ